MRNKTNYIIALVLLSFCVFSSAEEPNADEWEFSFAPYLFGLSLKGDVATLPGASPAEVDIPFEDLFENLEGALMGQFEARKGRFAVVADTYYSKLSTDESTPGPLYGDISYEMDLFYLSLAGSFRAYENDAFSIDVLAGVRYTYLENDLDVDGGILSAVELDETEDWFDPFVTIKSHVVLSESLYLVGWAGASVGGESEQTYDLFGGFGYNFDDDYSLVAGYRHMSIDYEKGDFLFDVEVSGPMLGLVIRF
ncbi:MAG: hypothetical protein NE330_06910 [Lentisphaeraceae bacterium]|nr:hypothetical protein [Lentisphaeraceae bacterium]